MNEYAYNVNTGEGYFPSPMSEQMAMSQQMQELLNNAFMNNPSNCFPNALQSFSPDIVGKAIRLLHPNGELFEIRVINGNYNASGYFQDADTAIRAMQAFRAGYKKEDLAKSANIFITLNPVNIDCYSRKQHDKLMENVKPTTNDKEITYLNWFLVDLDPKRISGTSSSAEELKAAEQKKNEIYQFLSSKGWKDPIQAMSGNGYHLAYRFYVPNIPENVKLWEQALKALQAKFGDDAVDVDITVFNPSRICKLWGTTAQKGSNTPERPHRPAYILDSTPKTIEINDTACLQQLIEELTSTESEPITETTSPSASVSNTTKQQPYASAESFDLQGFIAKHNIPVRNVETTNDGEKYILDHCLFDESHTGKDAAIFKKADGTLGYKCFHASCAGKHWKDVRQLYEPDAYEKKTPQRRKSPTPSENKAISCYDIDGSGKLTIGNFEHFCEIKGYTIRLNEITHMMEFEGFGNCKSDNTFSSASTILYSELIKESGLKKISSQTIEDYMTLQAKHNNYNPVLQYIEHEIMMREMQDMNAWDGIDRIQQIYDIFKIAENDISRMLIRKWLMQCIAGLHNTLEESFSLDIVLVFQGRQGLGKTRFFERLARLGKDNFFREGACIDPRNKDSIMQVTTAWICELGEIGSTMRKDTDAVKAFLTSANDTYRPPYGKTHETYPRLTSFVGTVNDEQFLVDRTGNRRFATIQLDPTLRIPAEKIQQFDSLQLWIQVYEMVEEAIRQGETYSSCFRLNEEEKAALEKRNSKLIKLNDVDVAVRDVLYQRCLSPHIMKSISPTEFISRNSELHCYKSNQVGKALKHLGIKSKRSGASILYELPVKSDNSNNHPNSYY